MPQDFSACTSGHAGGRGAVPSPTQQHALRAMQHKHLLQHEHRAISTELGGFPSSPATSPSTVRTNRSNHSFRSSTTVPLSSSFGDYFFHHPHQVQAHVITRERRGKQPQQ